jgi:general nucleoside transport system ATP-binding protein
VTAALALAAIRKSFDGFVALDDARFEAAWGEVHALLGENGAGKSSLMNIAAGLYAPESGAIAIDGRTVQLAGPRDARRLGVGMVHQHFKLVRPFTVAENVLLADPASAARWRFASSLRALERRIAERAAALGFEIDPRARIDALSIAEQQRAEILKVLLAGARIVILDEPTAVLTDGEAEALLRTARALAREGACVVLVTHKLADVTAFADRVTVMRGGRTVTTADPRGLSAEALVRLTVGEGVVAPHRRAENGASAGEVRLRVRGLTRTTRDGRRVLDGIDLDVHAGEMVGIAGVGGNGQSELVDALARDAARERIATIPADRYATGLAGPLAVAENFAIGAAAHGRYGSRWRLARGPMARATERAVASANVQGVRSVWQRTSLLSGGNAQKLLIARELDREPRVIVAHSPSRGLDARATAEVQARLLAARDAGAAVLLVSEDLDEILALADRVGVMSRGRIVAMFAQPADRQAIGAAMVRHA